MNQLALYAQPEFEEKRAIQHQLIAEGKDLVKQIAYHLLSRLPSSVQIGDLIQAGMVGLIEAARQFDPAKGASFNTFAGIRVRGAMIDDIRRGDWVPRSVYRNARMISEAIRKVEHELGREASPSDIANNLGVSLGEYYEMLNDAHSIEFTSIDEDGVENYLPTSSESSPHEILQNEDFQHRLSVLIAELPDKERMVLGLYYQEELNLKEIGKVLNVSESRVSQIHSQAMARLRARMQDAV